MSETAERLRETLLAAGLPIRAARWLASGEPVLTWWPEVTPEQERQAAEIVAAFDASDAAHTLWVRDRARADAKRVVANPDMLATILRAVVVVILQEIKAAVPLYSPPSAADFRARVRTVIDQGTADP